MKYTIQKITVKKILDSRGNPTIAVTVRTEKASGTFAVPSGASTGSFEAVSLKNINIAIRVVDTVISPALFGMDVCNQNGIDKKMIALDGTKNKSRLGANAMVGVSIAVAKAAARLLGMETFAYLRTLKKIKPSRRTPLLFMNLINGGKHAHNNLAFQEYHIVPITNNVRKAVHIGITVQKNLKQLLRPRFKKKIPVGDEGGYAPNTKSIIEPLKILSEVIKKSGYKVKIRLALDVAASSFYGRKKYAVDGKKINSNNLLKLYGALIETFDIFSIEDPFEENDFKNFAKLRNAYPRLTVVGDDLTTTNKTRLMRAIKEKSINAIIIKPNQIGTLSETLETMQIARKHNIACIVSHRSGETNDDFIADLAYAFGCFGLKAGAPLKKERMIKYKRLENIAKL